MKTLFATLILTLGTSAFASLNDQGDIVADVLNVSCVNPQEARNTMAFVVNWNTKTLTFRDIQAFGQAQILKDEAFPIDREVLAQDPKQIAIQYDWHFTAQYELKFERPLRGLYGQPKGLKVGMLFSGDDSDGAFFNDIPYTCTVR